MSQPIVAAPASRQRRVPASGHANPRPEPVVPESHNVEDLEDATTAEPLGVAEIEQMRKRVLDMGFGNPRPPGDKGKGKSNAVETELADMILRLTDPNGRLSEDQVMAQAETIQRLQRLLEAQKTFSDMTMEAERARWEAEKESWWRISAALTEKRRKEEGPVYNGDLENANKVLQADKRALKQQLHETQSRMQLLESELAELRPLFLIRPTLRARSRANATPIISHNHRPSAVPISSDARAEHLLLASRKLGPLLMADLLDATQADGALAVSSGAAPQTPKTPRKKKSVAQPAPATATPTFPDSTDTPAPGLEHLLSAARELDDGLAATASPAFKRRRIDPPGTDVDMTPTHSRQSTYHTHGTPVIEDVNRVRSALDVLAEQATAFGSQETTSGSSRRRGGSVSEGDAEGSPDLDAIPPPAPDKGKGRSKDALGPAFVIKPTTPHTPRVVESDVRRQVTPSPAPQSAGFSPRKRPRSPYAAPGSPVPSLQGLAASADSLARLPSFASDSSIPGSSTGPGTLMNELILNDKVVADAVAIVAAASVQADKGQLARLANEMPRRQRSPYVKWSKEEDELLTRAVAKYGQKWDLVQKALPSRGYHQVRQRWLRKLGVFDNKPPEQQPQSPVQPAMQPAPHPLTQTFIVPNGLGPRLGLAPLSSEAPLSLGSPLLNFEDDGTLGGASSTNGRPAEFYYSS